MDIQFPTTLFLVALLNLFSCWVSVLLEGDVLEEASGIKMEFQQLELNALGDLVGEASPYLINDDVLVSASQADVLSMAPQLPQLGDINLHKPPDPKPNAVMDAMEGNTHVLVLGQNTPKLAEALFSRN